MASWSSSLTASRALVGWVPRQEPGPAPEGESLVVSVPCSSALGLSEPQRHHEVVIHPDWSVATPHDLAAERIAVALGGHLSCLDLVDRALPAARSWVGLSARREVPAAKLDGRRRIWRPRWRAVGCCEPKGYRDIGGLGEHLRGMSHLAARFDADLGQVALLVGACRAAHMRGSELVLPREAAAEAARCCTRFTADVSELWRGGVHPDLVVAAHRSLGECGPQPMNYYLSVATRQPDIDWLARAVSSSADAGTCSDPSGALPAALAGWSVTRLPQWMVVELREAGYTAQDIQRMAGQLRRSTDGVGRTLLAWVHAGCRPSVDDLLVLEERGVPSVRTVSGPALRRLRDQAGTAADAPDDTELGLLLASAGTVPDAVAALRASKQRGADWGSVTSDG